MTPPAPDEYAALMCVVCGDIFTGHRAIVCGFCFEAGVDEGYFEDIEVFDDSET